MDEKLAVSNKDTIENNDLKFYKNVLIVFIILLFMNCMLDNNMYLNYLFNPSDYNLSKGKIIDISSNGKGATQLLVLYNLNGNIYEGTMISHVYSDHVGDEIAIIIKGEELGRNQFEIDGVSFAILMVIIGDLVMCYHEYSELK